MSLLIIPGSTPAPPTLDMALGHRAWFKAWSELSGQLNPISDRGSVGLQGLSSEESVLIISHMWRFPLSWAKMQSASSFCTCQGSVVATALESLCPQQIWTKNGLLDFLDSKSQEFCMPPASTPSDMKEFVSTSVTPSLKGGLLKNWLHGVGQIEWHGLSPVFWAGNCL